MRHKGILPDSKFTGPASEPGNLIYVISAQNRQQLGIQGLGHLFQLHSVNLEHPAGADPQPIRQFLGRVSPIFTKFFYGFVSRSEAKKHNPIPIPIFI